jgi:hypothetical protein
MSQGQQGLAFVHARHSAQVQTHEEPFPFDFPQVPALLRNMYCIFDEGISCLGSDKLIDPWRYFYVRTGCLNNIYSE